MSEDKVPWDDPDDKYLRALDGSLLLDGNGRPIEWKLFENMPDYWEIPQEVIDEDIRMLKDTKDSETELEK